MFIALLRLTRPILLPKSLRIAPVNSPLRAWIHTYYLIEKTAPAGYNTLKEAVQVTIGKDGTVSYGTSTGEVKIENNTGTELPSTGGIGTTIFYVLGGVLMAGAFVMLVVRKRMRAE